MRKENGLVKMNRHADNSTTIICIAHAGAGASAFNSWRSLLVGTASLWAARLPGRESRMTEEPLATIDEMADYLYGSVCDLQAENILLIGHCSGALVAYELVCRLTKNYDAERNLGLIVSSQYLPLVADSDCLAFSDLPLQQFMKGMQDIDGSIEELVTDESVMALLASGMRADFRAAGSYIFAADRERQKFPIAAFCGDRDSMINPAQLAGWRSATSGSFSVRTFQGGHFYIYEQGPAVCEILPKFLPAAARS